MTEVVLVTSFHAEGYENYGKRCLETFAEFWPEEYELWVYAENVIVEEKKNIRVFDLHAESAELIAFKNKWSGVPLMNGMLKGNGEYNYNFDAVRFSNKVFALMSAVKRTQSKYLVWLDADIVTKKEIPVNFIPDLLGEEYFAAYLGRMGYHSETGFVVYDMEHPAAEEFFSTFANMFLSGEVFTLLQWHDSLVFDTIRATMVAQGKIKCKNMSTNVTQMHPFVNCILGEYMDHLKGPDRKARGSSFEKDYVNQQAKS